MLTPPGVRGLSVRGVTGNERQLMRVQTIGSSTSAFMEMGR